MKTDEGTPDMQDRKVVLSTLWVFVTANYIFCDVLSLMDPDFLKPLVNGGLVEGIQFNQRFLLGAAILMEIPFVMILLSRVLKRKANRLANIMAGMIMAIVQCGSLFMGTSRPTLHYLFYSIIEIGCVLFIVGYAWKWREESPRPA